MGLKVKGRRFVIGGSGGGSDIGSIRNVDAVVAVATGRFLSHLQRLAVLMLSCVPLTPALPP